MKTRTYTLLAGLALFAACTDTNPPGVTGPDAATALEQGARRIDVMTQNLYVGADADAVLQALISPDPNDDLAALTTAIATLQRTDFATRAREIAEQLGKFKPHAVGLQEVYHIQVDLTPLGMPVQIDQDYLSILQAAIAARHLPYAVAAKVLDTDAQPFPGIRLVDWDVLLVDTSRVTVGTGVIAQTFAYNIGPLAPGVDKKAGYIVAPAIAEGVSVTFVTTHLESDLGAASHPQIAQLRAAQAAEIAGVLGSTPVAIVMGDLNDDAGSAMMQVLKGAGFLDVWTALRGRAPGLTCCHVSDLSDVVPSFDQRIDFVLARGFGRDPRGSITITGLYRIRGPLGLIWTSDHAGLEASLVVR